MRDDASRSSEQISAYSFWVAEAACFSVLRKNASGPERHLGSGTVVLGESEVDQIHGSEIYHL